MKNTQIDDSLELAALIKEAIASSNYSKKEIAVLMGCTPQAITGWEKTGRIQLSTLRKLGVLLQRNLLGVEGLISDLSPDMKLVLQMMSSTDDKGRMKIRIAAEDAYEKHLAHLRETKGIAGFNSGLVETSDFAPGIINVKVK